MSDVFTFVAEKRERAGKGAARAVRRQGLVPGVIYGDKQTPILIQMDPRQLVAQLNKAGFYTHKYDVKVGSEVIRAVAQAVQFDVVSDKPVHVDFLRISKDTELNAHLPVEFINQDKCPGLKRGGVLNVVHHEIEVVCKADDLPEKLVFDLATLDVGESLHLSAIALPAGVRVVSHEKNMTVATIVAPSGMKSDEAAAPAPATPAA